MSLTETAKRHGISRATVVRFVREARLRGLPYMVASQQPVELAA
jgi:DNA-binding MurR/RpiR family transcriptional regulator